MNVKPKLPCVYCGFPIKRKNKKYCNNQCAANFIKQQIKISIENGTYKYNSIGQYRNYLINKFGVACSLCGWAKINPYLGQCPIELDHIDGNPLNNDLNNLRLLCPNCHSLQKTYKRLNYGNGRYFRTKRYKEGKSY